MRVRVPEKDGDFFRKSQLNVRLRQRTLLGQFFQTIESGFFALRARSPFLISSVRLASDLTAMVSFRLSNSSGLISTATGEPFLVIITSSSVELTL